MEWEILADANSWLLFHCAFDYGGVVIRGIYLLKTYKYLKTALIKKLILN